MAEQLTMAERLAQAAAGRGSSGDNSGNGTNVPVVESVDSSTVSGKSKSGMK